jgi:hypothetical protein
MTNTPQDLINDWQARIDINQKAHWVCIERLDKIHFVIGLSAIILSTLAGATLLIGTENLYVHFLAGLIGLLAAVLAGIQTFYNHARRSGMHRAASTQLGQLRREIAALEKLPQKYLKTQTEILLHISDRLVKVEETAPAMEKDVIRQIREKRQDSDMLLAKLRGRA